ncbi:MAG: LysM peptidoglycan-binding domain-containing protein, partial [Clostridiales bacterium]|nr:LysM peptidoglycan-binding domain-containing protein [Clostridiales bacterium]
MQYTIRKGDSLGKIARAHGVDMNALAKANNISDVNKIRAGATLAIPGGTGGAGNA